MKKPKCREETVPEKAQCTFTVASGPARYLAARSGCHHYLRALPVVLVLLQVRTSATAGAWGRRSVPSQVQRPSDQRLQEL